MERLVAVLAESDGCDEGAVVFVGAIEDHPLALPEGAKHGTLEGAGAEEDLALVGVSDDDADAGDGVVGLDYALVHGQEASETRP